MAESESSVPIELYFNESYIFPLTGIPPLSVKLLAKEIGEVNDWYQLGTVLGVPPKRLDEIRKSSPVGGTGEWRISMLQAWMDSKPDTSWIDVIEAVKSLRHIVLAAILKTKYVPKTTESSHDVLGILCMCTIRLLCLITLFMITMYMYHVCVILFTTVLLFSAKKNVRGSC